MKTVEVHACTFFMVISYSIAGVCNHDISQQHYNDSRNVYLYANLSQSRNDTKENTSSNKKGSFLCPAIDGIDFHTKNSKSCFILWCMERLWMFCHLFWRCYNLHNWICYIGFYKIQKRMEGKQLSLGSRLFNILFQSLYHHVS